MKKSTTTSFRFSNIIIIALAFVLGAVLYFVAAVGIDKLTPAAGAASGAWQQVTVKVGVCDCITEFKPDPMLPGSGTVDDPFVSNNTSVGIAFKLNGTGKITIEDENGNVLYTYIQDVSNSPEQLATITFPNAGDHKLIIKIDGQEVSSNGVQTELYFRIGKLPPIIPDIPGVPSTGAYIYIGGYAVQTYSLIISGVAVAILAAFILFFYRRRQHRDETKIKVKTKKARTTTKKKA